MAPFGIKNICIQLRTFIHAYVCFSNEILWTMKTWNDEANTKAFNRARLLRLMVPT